MSQLHEVSYILVYWEDVGLSVYERIRNSFNKKCLSAAWKNISCTEY
jgi:hypothetical protein